MKKCLLSKCITAVVLAWSASPLQADNLLSAGFETAEGYSDGSLEQKLVTGYLGDAGNQQGWYGEDWASIGSAVPRYYTNNRGTVTDDRARTGTQSLKIPAEDSFYRMYLHSIEERSTGFLSIEMYVYLEAVDTAATANNVLLNAKDNFDGANELGNEYTMAAPTYGRGPGGRLYDFGNDYGTTPDFPVDADTPNSINFYSSGATPHTITQTGAGAAGAWVGRKAVIDIVAGKASYYVDTTGTWVLGASNIDMISRGSAGPALLDQVFFYQLTGPPFFVGDTFAYVDDVNVSWTSTIGLSGDHDHDGDVDAADYVVWRKTDINGPQGYTDWRANFGNPGGSGSGLSATAGLSSSSGTVPEPTTAILVLLTVVMLPVLRRRPYARLRTC